jgi:hypothetical protein
MTEVDLGGEKELIRLKTTDWSSKIIICNDFS